MVAWLCGLACEVLSLLPASRADALRTRLELSEEELHQWQDMSRRMFVPFHDDGIISQFEGYDELRGARLGRLPGALRKISSDSIGSCAPRAMTLIATRSPNRPTR